MHKKSCKPSPESSSTSDHDPKDYKYDDSCKLSKFIKFTWCNMTFRPSKLLGFGTYGEVHQARTPDSLDIAVKVLRLEDEFGAIHMVESIRDLTREYALLHQMSECPYICRALGLVGVESLHNTMVGNGLMMELCDNSLHNCLKTMHGPEHDEQKVLFLHHIASGIMAMHEKRLVHLDLKSNNILLTKSRSATDQYTAVIADFGLCRQCDSSHNITVRKNTVYASTYRCPEATMKAEPWRRKQTSICLFQGSIGQCQC